MNPKLKKLQDKWYKRLAKDGFEDIEKQDKDGEPYSSIGRDKSCLTGSVATSLYYRRLSGEEHFRRAGILTSNWPLRWTKTKTQQRDRIIWKLYSEGKTINQTADYLKSLKRDYSKTCIALTILRYKAILDLLKFDTVQGWQGNVVDQLLIDADTNKKIKVILKRTLRSFR